MNNKYSTAGELPPACNGVDPCSDVPCQQAIAQTHEINEVTFNSRIIPEAGAPKVYSASEMEKILAGGTCGADEVVFDQNVATNAELNATIASDSGPLVGYTFPLFKGILSEDAETFSYYIASGGSQGRDVIFQVEFKGGVVQFYDCSDERP